MRMVLLLVMGLVGCSSRTDPFAPCQDKFREYREANRQCQGGKCDGVQAFIDLGMQQHTAEQALEYCCAKAAATVQNPALANRLLVLCKNGADVPWEPERGQSAEKFLDARETPGDAGSGIVDLDDPSAVDEMIKKREAKQR